VYKETGRILFYFNKNFDRITLRFALRAGVIPGRGDDLPGPRTGWAGFIDMDDDEYVLEGREK